MYVFCLCADHGNYGAMEPFLSLRLAEGLRECQVANLSRLAGTPRQPAQSHQPVCRHLEIAKAGWGCAHRKVGDLGELVPAAPSTTCKRLHTEPDSSVGCEWWLMDVRQRGPTEACHGSRTRCCAGSPMARVAVRPCQASSGTRSWAEPRALQPIRRTTPALSIASAAQLA